MRRKCRQPAAVLVEAPARVGSTLNDYSRAVGHMPTDNIRSGKKLDLATHSLHLLFRTNQVMLITDISLTCSGRNAKHGGK